MSYGIMEGENDDKKKENLTPACYIEEIHPKS